MQFGDEISDWEPVTCGVPQGSILGPLLFVLYVNDISSCIKNCKYQMYADDLQIYLSFSPKTINHAIQIMNNDISNIFKWTKENGLKLNGSKTKAIIISHSRLKSSIDLDSLQNLVVDDKLCLSVIRSRALG